MPRHCDGSKNTCGLSHIQPMGPTFWQGFWSRAARSYLYPQHFRWLSIDWCCLSSMDDICKWLNNRNLPEMTTSKHPDLDICTYILGRTHSSCNANGTTRLWRLLCSYQSEISDQTAVFVYLIQGKNGNNALGSSPCMATPIGCGLSDQSYLENISVQNEHLARQLTSAIYNPALYMPPL